MHNKDIVYTTALKEQSKISCLPLYIDLLAINHIKSVGGIA